ncbi:MAG: NUDIX domain-containing protein [Candidatus Woesearchaeota archaeon]|nr:NUDIX domain-containing protein [Candidatus Woesearchaeota archaeon]
MEIIDIVDEHDTVVGSGDIRTVHKKKLLHRTAGVLIFKDSSRKEMAIQKRSMSMVNAPGKWAHTSGHIPTGDTYLEAAKKELQEEMFHGIPFPELEYEKLFKIHKHGDGDEELITIYAVEYDGELAPDHGEVEVIAWVSLEQLYGELQDEKYTETFREVMEAYKSISST